MGGGLLGFWFCLLGGLFGFGFCFGFGIFVIWGCWFYCCGCGGWVVGVFFGGVRFNIFIVDGLMGGFIVVVFGMIGGVVFILWCVIFVFCWI